MMQVAAAGGCWKRPPLPRRCQAAHPAAGYFWPPVVLIPGCLLPPRQRCPERLGR
jgi:hypothetical protein